MENGHDNLARLVAELRKAVIARELHRGRPQARRSSRPRGR
ncbi:MAG TPA: hypothetical protein VHV27_01610 [Phenylobacterium sp.]|jgi:hypothetical protein|nr:hypothetical protein [Phenylobacterium sp.]